VKEKILCIQLKQIGDVLMNTPAIRALTGHFPDGEIHFLTIPPAHQIFEFNPFIQKIHYYPKDNSFLKIISLIKRLKKENYSHVIDFHGVPKTALLSWLTRAPKRIGYQLRGRSLFYTNPVSSSPHLLYSGQKKNYLLSALGINVKALQLNFFTSDQDHQKADSILKQLKVNQDRFLISVSPVSRRDYKIWPADRFSAVCDFLIENYQAQIIFLWGPGEYHFIEAVRKNMQNRDLGDYEIPTLRETVALLKKVDLHIGNDNGPMHFANAAGRPSIAIFGRPLMENWLEPDSPTHLGIEFDPGCKKKCFYPKCQLECLTGIEIKTVTKTIQSLLNHLKDKS
jgi:heptosyltransferase III